MEFLYIKPNRQIRNNLRKYYKQFLDLNNNNKNMNIQMKKQESTDLNKSIQNNDNILIFSKNHL